MQFCFACSQSAVVHSHPWWPNYCFGNGPLCAILHEVNILLEKRLRAPLAGTGKPELLKGDPRGYWSRRITQEHRLIYKLGGEYPRVAQCGNPLNPGPRPLPARTLGTAAPDETSVTFDSLIPRHPRPLPPPLKKPKLRCNFSFRSTIVSLRHSASAHYDNYPRPGVNQ